ncbi:transmembrane signal receptor [Lithospermum erythrorhizon]|uniref:non-specific serine/threonine protein kinase n=1 Tax=Lithospermum erythrorhizon TaxID=34254 RepID=A0AAV3PD95_LITER
MAMLIQLNYLLIFLSLLLHFHCCMVFALNNEVNVLLSWLHTSPSQIPSFSSWNSLDSDPCKWSYISCSSQNVVTQIKIEFVHLALHFPSNISSLHSLESLIVSGVNLTGSIPLDIGDCMSLRTIDVSFNNLVGSIPETIGILENLEDLILNSNRLSGKIPEEIEEIGNCQNLQVLGLADTTISGSMPRTLGKLKNLRVLSVYNTMISGRIPSEIGNCSERVELYLYQNQLSGSIPGELGNLQKLEKMLLWRNNLVGHIPEEIGNCRSLVTLDLSVNSHRKYSSVTCGILPSSLSSLSKLQVLDVSRNQFSGEIPGSYGQLTSLSRLVLSNNMFSGLIPSTLGHCSGIVPPQITSLSKLSVLHLSHNGLGGDLMALGGLVNLVSLNVSNNYFTGYLPDNKLFRQLTAIEFAGNKGLCAHGHDSCFLSKAANIVTESNRDAGRTWKLKLAIALLAVVAASLAILGVLAVLRVKKMNREDTDSELGGDSLPWQFTPFQKLNFTIEEMLECLVEVNVIGKECSGIVYWAELENGEVIAVKKLWPSTLASGYKSKSRSFRVRDSFSTEVKSLGSIRHKNIVWFLGGCWNQNTRDIKANNILIGLDFETYIADFGLAKLVDDADYGRSSKNVAGSYGYMAPGVAMLFVNPSPDDRPTMKDVAAMLYEIRHENDQQEERLKNSCSASSLSYSSSVSANAKLSFK